MKKLALWGYFGFGNVGDEALLSAVLPHLKNEEVHIFSGELPSVQNSQNIVLESRSPKNLFRVIKKSDGFILGPGGLLHERKSGKGTWYHLAGPILSRFLSKPYCAIGQQIGSFTRFATKKLVKFGLKKANFLTVRDEQSFLTAEKLGLKPTLSSDLAFLLKPNEPSKTIRQKIQKLPKPRIIFSPATSSEYKLDIPWIVKILKYILKKTGASLILVPFFPGRDDETISELSKLLPPKNVLSLASPISWSDGFGIFQMADFSVPMRLHSMIASTLSNVPFLPIVYHEKVRMIGKEIGCSEFLENSDFEKTIDNFLNNLEPMRSTLRTNLPKLQKKAQVSIDLLKEFVHEIP
jgi:polysaccharide pyruvyl transferase CsaB